jgi:diguanylate cyclase (GGDEF)-like protein
MRLRDAGRRPTARLTLTQRVALLSLVPTVAMGFVLARVLQQQIVNRTLADASQSAALIAHIGIQPRLSQRDLQVGLSPAGIRSLDEQLRERSVTRDLARVKIWNAHDKVVYSDDHQLIGKTLPPSDDLLDALAGRPEAASVVTPSLHTETASEVGLGKLVEVYVPLRFAASGPPEGAFEIYLSYKPIAAAISADEETIALVVFAGLALLWAVLFRIVAGASRRLRRQSEENYRLARYDKLTGLPNRTLFIEEAARRLGGERSDHAGGAVLLVALDRFKEINDTLGHVTGDRVLREVATRLRSELDSETLLARVGGDEYAILCMRASDVSIATSTAATVHAVLEAPIMLDGVALNVEASIGIAVAETRSSDLDTLLRRADVALARAKAHRSGLEVYAAEYDSFDAARLKLLGEVRPALQRGDFVLHYQPKMDLETRRVIGVEALLRWRHHEHGMLAPMEFIPLIEQTSLVTPVTLYVIDRALRQTAAWRKLGFKLGISVNLSARNLLDSELPNQIEALLETHGVASEQLVVEVTESAAMADPDSAAGVLAALRAKGVGVSIDDFGTGNASLAYLAKLPASEIKIDRSFITNLSRDPRAQAIVRSTIELARNLQLNVVAEGIESEPILEQLIEWGCPMGQGFLVMGQGFFISRPLPAEEIVGWLAPELSVSAA